MKKICVILLAVVFSSCDYVTQYTFKVKNATQETITLKFEQQTHISQNAKEVILLPSEEKIVRVITFLNVPAHDCLTEHEMKHYEDCSNDLVFDTYVNGEKLDKQLWRPDNWMYNRKSKYSAEYTMTITEEMIEM